MLVLLLIRCHLKPGYQMGRHRGGKPKKDNYHEQLEGSKIHAVHNNQPQNAGTDTQGVSHSRRMHPVQHIFKPKHTNHFKDKNCGSKEQ